MIIIEWIESNETTVRLGIFLGLFLIMATWEWINPKRKLIIKKTKRWLSHLSLITINALVLYFVVPVATVGVALYAQNQQLGLLLALDLPPILLIIFSIIILDLAIYGQHLIMHKVPILWRLHRVHHSDIDYDVTTGTRFHPIEMVLSLFIKFIIILILGAPVAAVIIFETILNGMAMFNHANIGLPKSIEKTVRSLLVTPDMHRIHHSTVQTETDSNYGFNLSIWDRIFNTYTDYPQAGEKGLIIGIKELNKPIDVVNLSGILKIPFKTF